ncbi:MAG: type II toxin-antitoxin system RelE/ParE family toxin [Chloroflexota bacterium]|nr:type II toxin-antitoxin system RelE/ParE family toxin [Chloroflexota bacterium]
MALVWSARAKRDVREIGVYIAQNNRTAAVAMVKRIVAVAENLNEYPLMGQAGRVDDTRELVALQTSYIVVYRTTTRGSRIIAVMHTSRESF